MCFRNMKEVRKDEDEEEIALCVEEFTIRGNFTKTNII